MSLVPNNAGLGAERRIMLGTRHPFNWREALEGLVYLPK